VSDAEPTLRVVNGQPTAEELAALVVALTTQPPDEAPAAPARPSGWTDRAAALRGPLAPGPGAWRASARRS
jgi:hypothetical protein